MRISAGRGSTGRISRKGASIRTYLEPDDIPRGALGAIGAEPGSGSGTGVPAGLGEGSGLGTPGRRTPVKAAAGEGLAGSYGDDSAQIAAATAAAVAAAAESGLGRVGKRPPRVPSTLGVDEEFEGPDTSSLAAFLLSLISINPRGNKASSDTCSESGGSYVDSDFEEEEYEEVGEEDGGVVDVTPSSSSSSLSADAGCGDVALTSASRLEARENNNGANQGGVATSASAAVSSASSVTLVSAAGAVSGAVSVSRASLAGADEQLQQRMSEPAARYDGGVVPAVRHVSLRDLPEPACNCQWTRVGSPVQHIQARHLSIDPLPPQLHDARPLPAGEPLSILVLTFIHPSVHGISLSTLCRRSSMLPGPCLLVVTEDNGTVFGGFSSQALVASNRRKYQGSSDVFVFTTITGEPTVYKVTGANRYFILCLNEALSFGGGGHFALCLQEDLLTGSSGACETFCSPCLSKSEDFKIKHVEVRVESACGGEGGDSMWT
ncbi:unnamed protein product [Closterium sp. Naga37s-1]|nr:unnamed protein product [Closterium sp. Naga37s-1]